MRLRLAMRPDRQRSLFRLPRNSVRLFSPARSSLAMS